MFLFARFGDGPRPPKMPRCDNRGGFRGWGGSPCGYPAVEDTVATATLADTREEEDTKAAQGEAIEEQAVATEEAMGLRQGAGGSDGSSMKSSPLTKARFSPTSLSCCSQFCSLV